MSPHLLIFGFGYTAQFLVKKTREINIHVTATTRNAVGLEENSCVGGDYRLIHFSEQSIQRALASATHVLISTPPTDDCGDPVLANFSHLLKKYTKKIQWIGYLSSTSVYGDHQGRWVDEASSSITLGAPGELRLSAENQWIAFAQAHHVPLTIFRLAGIYGPQRNVLARLLAGKNDTVVKPGHFFSRIHVDDIVLAVLVAIQQAAPGVSIYNVADDKPTPGDVVDQYAATLLNLPRLHEVAYTDAQLSPMAKTFYSQNKQVSNTKLKQALNIQLMYPSYKEGLAHLLSQMDF